jgi:hypothetical protein
MKMPTLEQIVVIRGHDRPAPARLSAGLPAADLARLADDSQCATCNNNTQPIWIRWGSGRRAGSVNMRARPGGGVKR